MVRIDRLLSSTETRAVETAQILAAWNVRHPTIHTNKKLVEQRYGKKVMDQLVAGNEERGFELLWGTSDESGAGLSFDYRPPGGESYNDVIARGRQFIQEMLRKYGLQVDVGPSTSNAKSLNCEPETLPPGIPHLVVVSHNILLTLLWETLKDWRGELENAGGYHWDNAGWQGFLSCHHWAFDNSPSRSRHMLYWDCKDDRLYCVDLKLPERDTE